MKNFVLEKNNQFLLVDQEGLCLAGCDYPVEHFHKISDYQIIDEFEDLIEPEQSSWLSGD